MTWNWDKDGSEDDKHMLRFFGSYSPSLRDEVIPPTQEIITLKEIKWINKDDFHFWSICHGMEEKIYSQNNKIFLDLDSINTIEEYFCLANYSSVSELSKIYFSCIIKSSKIHSNYDYLIFKTNQPFKEVLENFKNNNLNTFLQMYDYYTVEELKNLRNDME